MLVVSSPLELKSKLVSVSSTEAIVSLGKAEGEIKAELWLEDLTVKQIKLEPVVIAGEYILTITQLAPDNSYKLYATAIGHKSQLLEFTTLKSVRHPRLPEVGFGKIHGPASYIVAQLESNGAIDVQKEAPATTSTKAFILPNEYGNWTIDLAGFKGADGEYYSYTKENSTLRVDVYSGGQILATRLLELAETDPFPDITISDNALVRNVEAQIYPDKKADTINDVIAQDPEKIELALTREQYQSIFAQPATAPVQPTPSEVKPRIAVSMTADGDILNAQATTSGATSGPSGSANLNIIADEIISNFSGYREYEAPLPPAFLGFFTNYGYSAIGTISLLNSCGKSSETQKMCELYRDFLSREAQKRGGRAITTFEQARSFGSSYPEYYSDPIFAQDFHREVVKKAGYEGIGASKSPNNIGNHGCIDIWDNKNKSWSASRKVLIVDTAREIDFVDYRNWVRRDETIYPDFKGHWGFDMPQEVGGSRGGIFRWSRSDICDQIDIEYKIGNTRIAQTPLPAGLNSVKAESKPATSDISQRGYYTISLAGPINYSQKFYADAGAKLTVFVDTNQNQQKDIGESVLTSEQLARFSLERNSDFIELSLKTGWNLIHIPVVRPEGMPTIKSFIDEAENQGSVILHASNYSGDSAHPFLVRQDGQQYGQDFELRLGSGILVYVTSSSGPILVAGDLDNQSTPLQLNQGLQLIGFSQPQLTQNLASASSFLNDTSARFISRLNNESYQTLLKDEIDFGTNFQLNSTLGYFVLVE